MHYPNINFKFLFINILVLLLPISFILGNLSINFCILLIILFSLIFFRSEIFKVKLSKIDFFVIILFLYILINGIYNNFFNFNFSLSVEPNQNIVLNKSLLYLRYFVLYFVLKYLVNSKIINLKLFFLIFGLFGAFVSLDLLIQFSFGKDLFGFEQTERRLSGPFGDEYIAGSYIQRFSIFLPFWLLIFSEIKNQNLKKSLFIFLLFFSLFSIFISGNRMPFLMFLLILGMIFIFVKDIRKFFTILLIIFSLSFFYIFTTNKNVNVHYRVLMIKGYEVISYLSDKISNNQLKPLANSHIKEFETGIQTWKQNKLFGGGIKSFYPNCSNMDPYILKNFIGSCNSHPHNYYLQIASELGIIGLLLIIYVFYLIVFNSLKKIYLSKNSSLLENRILIPFLILFVAEIFPFKTSGSFVTTSNSTFLFIILSFVVGLSNYKHK